MLVYFIRHGQSETNCKGEYCGQGDAPLTELGVEQAKSIRPKLADVRFDHVYSSDLCRAVTTAVTALPGCEPILDSRLREINIGTLTGKSIKDFRRDNPDLVPYLNARDSRPFGGECGADQLLRLSEFIGELSREAYETVAVFCHGGILYCTLEYALGVSFPIDSLARPNCMIAVYELMPDGKMKLIKWNI